MRIAIGLAAAAEARSRGMRRPRRVYDVVSRMTEDPRGMLAVWSGRGAVKLAAAKDVAVVDAMVIELAPLVDAVTRSHHDVG